MSVINKLFKKKVDVDLLKNKDFSEGSESGGAAQKSGRIPAQSGRTMTEMLGVLAIVGVLSIGGVAGYNYAMDKYRANVTINDINLRAVDLITQASQQQPLSLAEWGTTSTAGYTFNPPRWENDFIALDILNLPQNVCQMVVDTLGEQFDMDINGERIDVSDECGLSDSNIITVYFDGGGAGVTCTPACGTGKVCEGGVCIDEEMQPGTSGPRCTSDDQCPECRLCDSSVGECRDKQPNGTSCTGGICSNGECVAGGCSSNSDCAADFFCADPNSSCSQAHPSICQKMNFTRKTITVNGTSETWYISSNSLRWWDAQSACERLGKTMVTVDELVSGWSGSRGTFTRTERAQKLSDAIGGPYTWVWTSDDYSSCNAFFVLLSSDFNNVYSGDPIGPFALCR